jgi:probable rRNA maturation factor
MTHSVQREILGMALTLDWNNEQSEFEIGEHLIEKLTELLNIAAEQEGVEAGEVALTFVDDETIRQLNREYRGIDKPTDVLSFSMLESGEGEIAIVYDDEEESDAAPEGADGEEDGAVYPEPLGDIVISVQRAVAQAEEYGHSVEREIGFLFVHGFLHLLGYDHGNEAEENIMFNKQEEVLKKAGLPR